MFAAWLLETLPAQVGALDDLSGFTAHHAVVGELVLRYPGLRVGRTGRLFEALVPAVLEQKVVGKEAHRAWRFLLGRYGTAAPGPAPAGMRVIPPPSTWARIPSWDWHLAGVEGVRTRTIIAAANVASRLEQVPDLDPAEADRRLRALPGIGPWTSAEIRQRAAGDADAVSVGDYHLPRAVGWTLAGRITDDAGMLELLAPYAGHRHRVARLIEVGGRLPPRRDPACPSATTAPSSPARLSGYRAACAHASRNQLDDHCLPAPTPVTISIPSSWQISHSGIVSASTRSRPW